MDIWGPQSSFSIFVIKFSKLSKRIRLFVFCNCLSMQENIRLLWNKCEIVNKVRFIYTLTIIGPKYKSNNKFQFNIT